MSEQAAGSDVLAPEGAEPGHADHYDPESAKIGMWLFLFTEVLLFGVLFICYAVYLSKFTWQFRVGSGELSVPIGTTNTTILLTSSLTMALAIAAMERSRKKLCVSLLMVTLACAVAFLVIKSFEWGTKFEHGLYPGSEVLAQKTRGEMIFFGLYYTMTGLHALHIVFGGAVILVALRLVKKNRITPERSVFLHNAGLYWHLVDLVWIYLFPLFYLISEHA